MVQNIVARCEVDAAVEKKEGEAPGLLQLRAVNEFDLKTTDWRKKIELQRASVLAMEMKNNSNKLARWAAQSILAGVDGVKLGYVSRVSAKQNGKHAILATQTIAPADFATMMNLPVKNMWAVLSALVDLCMKQENGKYVLLKDANKVRHCLSVCE